MTGKRKEVEQDIITNPVKNYFEEKKKSLCIEDFCLPTEYTYKKMDLAVIPQWKNKDFKIKWDDDLPLIDMVAVESKCSDNAKQSVLDAIPQALVYQHFFLKVYIAYPSGNIGPLVEFLKDNGIGRIPVNKKKKHVEKDKIIEPIEANNKFKPFIRSNKGKIADKLAVIALGRWKFGDSIKERREHYGDFNVPSKNKDNKSYNKGWVAKQRGSTEEESSIQWNISVGYGWDEEREPKKVYSGINIEKPKKSYGKIFEKLDKNKFLELIKKLPDDYWYWYYKKSRKKGGYKKSTQNKKRISELTLEDITTAKEYMTEPYGGYFNISKVVWEKGNTEKECKQKMNEVKIELEPIFSYLLSCSKNST